jgi:2-oxoglutarate dehydrogenase E2 component (dihydrolipoamide succinyltransferase)
MGVSVEEGTVVEWLKQVGDSVAAEEAICAIATDKVDTEVVAPVGGVLTKILIEVDEVVPVGGPLAEISTEEDGGVVAGSPDATPRDSALAARVGNDAPRRVSGEPATTPPPRPPGLAERAAAGRDAFGRFDPKAAARAVLSFVPQLAEGEAKAGASVLASPVARRMARDRGVDLSGVEGTGRRGRIRKADVERALAGTDRTASALSAGPSLGAGGLPVGYEGVPHEVLPTSRVRRAIAEHMVRSRRTAAHMTTEVDVDLAAVVRARGELNAARLPQGLPKLSYLPFIARAACDALLEHPRLNATFLGERTIEWRTVNLGIAVDTAEGLLVPVIRDCDRLTTPAIGEAIAELAERARERRLVPDDLAGGTFTLSNPGSVGAVSAPAIINQPQVAILGVPAIQRRPWVISDEHGEESIAIRPILRLAVTFDHRAVDGADATRFAVAVKNRLEGSFQDSHGPPCIERPMGGECRGQCQRSQPK